MSSLLDGWIILVDHWPLVVGMLVLMLASQWLVISTLRSFFDKNLTTDEYISLSMTGWLVPMSILSIIWTLWGIQKPLWVGIFFLIIFTFLLLRLKSDIRPASSSTIFIFALAFFFSLLFRLAFISKALFPSYFDSPFHFVVSKNIAERGLSWTFHWLSTSYYHINFHILTAFFASLFHAQVTQVMLLLGQLFLVFIPFSLFFLVKHTTRSNMAGWFTIILSAFGWYMPAHAVDWGKYPALMSLGLIVFVLNAAYLISQNKNDLLVGNPKRQWALYGLLGLSMVLSVLTHSRSLIVIGIAVLAWSAATWLQKLSQRCQIISFIVGIIGIVALTFLILKQNILVLVFDPYLVRGLWVTLFVLVLSISAFRTYPRLTFACVFSIGLSLIGLLVPIPGIIPGRDYLTLLDRPFVEMILFLPLSVLGGLGLAALKETSGRLGRYVGWMAVGFVAVNALFTYNPYPSDCCVLVGKDDVVAMDWMANQLPVDARIGISSTEVKVNITDAVEGSAGKDAGAWITPLTERVTVMLPYNMEFDQPQALEKLCEMQIGYLYVGELGQTFDDARLSSLPAWYRPLLSMPKARVYEVVGCN